MGIVDILTLTGDRRRVKVDDHVLDRRVLALRLEPTPRPVLPGSGTRKEMCLTALMVALHPS
jgi:hypothetical protein